MSEEMNSNKVRIGVIGLGGRGRGLLKSLLGMDDVEIVAISDLYDDRCQLGLELVEAAGKPKVEAYKDYKALLARDDVQGVIIPSSWTSHGEIAIAAMKAGKYAAPEVGGATTLEECWELVRTSEATGMPCMILSNCNYGRDEMALLNMVKKGMFGELIHCQCGYEHDLRPQVAQGEEKRHYRLGNYLNRNAEVYPTHGIGPVSKYLGINRGNRFVSLTSMASKSRGLNEWAAANLGKDHPVASANVALGDVVTTIIKCANGETVVLTHDTTLPRPYSRAGRVQGTKGLWMEDNHSIYLEGTSPDHKWEAFEEYRKEHDHPLWKEFIANGVRGGHGGMDYLVLRSYVESVKGNLPTPIDIYDTATWMAITALSEQSISLGSSAVAFPDFTSGKWINRAPGSTSKYALDVVDESRF